MTLFIGTGLDAALRRAGGPPRPPNLRAPFPLRAPAMRGTGRIGAPLTVDPGVWKAAATFVYIWLRNGAPIEGAAGTVYAPGPIDDRAVLVCRVTAVNDSGQTSCDTPGITIAFPPPVLVGVPPDINYTQLTGPHIVDVSRFFSGSSLSFSIAGDDVAIDASTGRVTVGAAALLSGVSVLVTAANSGGTAEASFNIKVTPALKPVLRAKPALAGTGRVGEALTVDPGLWDGEPDPELTLQWLRDGAPVVGAVASRYTPGAAEDGAAVACRVTARNLAGETVAETEAVRVAHFAPVASKPAADVVLPQGADARDMPMAAFFTGAGLRFSVAGAAATIDPATGILAIPTTTVRAAEQVTVTATNSGGAAEVRFAVRVLAAPAAVGTPAAVAFAQGATAATIAAHAFFAGTDLVYALEGAPAGVTIVPGSGLVTVPTAAALTATLAVRATNAVGAVVQRVPVRVLAAPAAVGTPAAVAFAQGATAATIAAHAFFAGADLVYALEGAPAGVTIVPASGLVTVPTAAALTTTLAVRATNAVGAVVQRVPVRVLAAPAAVGTPAAVAFAQGATAATIAAHAFFAGADLVYALEGAPAGVTIVPGSGLVTVPTAAALTATLAVRATNAVGAVVQRVPVRVLAAPAAVGTPAAVAFAQGATAATIAAHAFFAGADLVYALEGAPAGVTIVPGSGLVTVPTAAALTATLAVRATNAVGAVVQRVPVRVLAAPVAVGTPAAVAFAQGAMAATIAAHAFFAGADLVYALEGAPAGVTIVPGSGLVTVPTAAALTATLAVRATNAVGAVVQRVPVRVLAAPAATQATGAVVFAQGAGTRTVATQGFFTGAELAYALVSAPAGVTVAAGSGLVTIPTTAALEGVVVVRATNAVGAATLSFALEVQAPPRAVGTPEALGFVRAAGSRTVSTQGFFAGSGLVFALDAAPAGVTINPGSGLLLIPTTTAFQGTIRVRATNVAGSVAQNFPVTVGAPSQTPVAVTPAAPQDGDWILGQITVQK